MIGATNTNRASIQRMQAGRIDLGAARGDARLDRFLVAGRVIIADHDEAVPNDRSALGSGK